MWHRSTGGRRRGRKASYGYTGRRTRYYRGAKGRERPMSVADEAFGMLLVGVLMVLVLCVGLPLVVVLLLYTAQYPVVGVSAIGAVGLGCWCWTGRPGRHGAQRPLVAQAPAQVRRATLEIGDEQSVTRAWMEATAGDGADVRLQHMAQAWLEGERDLRALRAERARTGGKSRP